MEPSPLIEAVVLAAGSSRRLGRPKALLEVGGRTVLERLLNVLEAAGIPKGVIVAGEHLDEMRSQVPGEPLRYAQNPMPEAGRTGSILIGLASIDPESDVLLWPVDRPLAALQTVRALRAARQRERGEFTVLIPSTGNRAGHPILIAAGLRNRLLGESPEVSLRDAFTRVGAVRIFVDVGDDLGILQNLDDESDLEKLRSLHLKF